MISQEWQEHDARPQPPRPPSERELERQRQFAAEQERRRLRERSKIREQVAAARLAEMRAAELRDTIAALDLEKERLAAEHIAACQPLQAELAQIEARQTAAIRDRHPLDPQLESRRKKLLDQLAQHNAELSEAIARQSRLAEPLHGEAHTAAMAAANTALESSLIATASAPLRAKLAAVQRLVEFLGRDTYGDPADPFRAAWRDEIETILNDARRRSAELVRQCLAEE